MTPIKPSPSTAVPNGRGEAGRFTSGNRFGKGNPHARQVARLRAALLKSVSPDDLRAVMASLLAKAKDGDVAAARELLQRLLGPPVELDLTDRLMVLEQRIEEIQQKGRE